MSLQTQQQLDDNIFTFDQDQQSIQDNFQETTYQTASIIDTPQQLNNYTIQGDTTTLVKNSLQNWNVENNIFVFQEEDEDCLQENSKPKFHKLNLNTQAPNSSQQTTNLTLQKSQRISEFALLKNKILFKQQDNNFITNSNNLHAQNTSYTTLKNPVIEPGTQIIDIKPPKTKNGQAKSNINNKNIKSQSNYNKSSNSNANENSQQFLTKKQHTTQTHTSSSGYSIQGAKVITPSNTNTKKQFQYVEEHKAIKVSNLKQFLFTQLSPQYKVNVLIKKVNEGFLGNIVNKTKYYVSIQENSKFLFSVTKEGFNKFIFSMSKDDPTSKNKNYLGQLFARDFSNTQFLLFDYGFDPKGTKCLEFSFKQLAWIKYEQSSGPRKFNVTISANNQGFHCIEDDFNIIEKKWTQKKDRKNLCRLYNKEPLLDQSDGNYKLDFKGMIGKPSVKNFVLSSEEFEDCLIFARKSDDTYGLEIKNPFSLIQAVGVCMASIYHKVVF